eukprot:scaffold8290_cov174-Amphora_coffeaeformis.AAC.7
MAEVAQNQKQQIMPLADVNPLLLVFLGLHHPKSSVDGLEFLTVPDLVQLPCLCRVLREHLQTRLYKYARDGNENYRLPFPGFPGLFQTTLDTQDGATRGLFPHQLASLSMMHRLENPAQGAQFGDLRGGILGDAPGLGKTVTVLALLASTAGRRPLRPMLHVNPENLVEGWLALTQNPAFQYDLNLALKPIAEWIQVTYVNNNQVVVNGISCNLNEFSTCRAFVRHLRRQLKRRVPVDQLEMMANKMELLQLKLDKRQRAFFATRAGQRYCWERSLLTTTATLIVVPDVLLEHWFEQTLHYLNLSYFTDKPVGDTVPRGIVYLDGIGDMADASVPLTGRVRLDQDMANARNLTGYLMVVTTFSRCEREYRIENQWGRWKSEPARKRARHSVGTTYSEHTPVSPLLQLHWLRLIVDEGHELGQNHANGRGLTRILHEIAAERRWVLSGTPTTGDQDAKDFTASCLDQLQRLLCFLRHPTYGAVPAESSRGLDAPQSRRDIELRQGTAQQDWETSVKQPFLEERAPGREELLRVLREIMVIHQKEHISLPRPTFTQGEVSVEVPEAEQQKILAAKTPQEASRLLEVYLESSDFQSMVDEAQGKYIVDTLRHNRGKRRLHCGIAGSQNDVGRNGSVVEYNPAFAPPIDLRPVKAVVYSSNQNILLSVEEFLHRNLHAENIAALYSGDVGDMSAELSRFRNGLKRFVTCPTCGGTSDYIFDIQRKAKCRCTLMEVTVSQGGHETRILIEPMRVRRALPQLLGGNVTSLHLGDITHDQYWQAEKKWNVGDVLEIDICDPHPLLPPRQNAETWAEYGSADCASLAEKYDFQGRDWFFGPLKRNPDHVEEEPVRAVLRKWQPCGRFHDPNRWYKGPRFDNAPIEMVKEDVFVLCLNADVSTGLDLSFVTHIFLLEPIEDSGLLRQVTSRAHRLGATGSVTVETVNVWQEMSDATRNATRIAGQHHQTDKGICEHCCRSFPTKHLAEIHERTTCLLNPSSTAEMDLFSLGSLYRELRPPPALCTDPTQAKG